MNLDVVIPQLSGYRLGQSDGTRGVTVDAHGVGGDFYIFTAFGLYLAFGDGPYYPLPDLFGIQLLSYAAGKDDLSFVVVLAVGVELRHDRLAHLLRQLVSDRGPHAEKQEVRIDPLDGFDNSPG